MLAKRIITCLDVRDGRVVKGVNFVNIRDAGDPVELAKYYSDQGADEIVFLDITATSDGRDTVAHVVERTAAQVFVPLTVGGGIRTLEDFRRLLRAGADKISVNSAAVADPTLIARGAERFGSQCVVLAIDARSRGDGTYEVVTAGGRTPTGLDAVEWARRGQALGAGGILGMDVRRGFRIFCRDRHNHASPNSAQTESVCAGLLGLRLAGDAWYHGVRHEKPTIGDPAQEIRPGDIPRACRLMTVTAALALAVCAGTRWLLMGLWG